MAKNFLLESRVLLVLLIVVVAIFAWYVHHEDAKELRHAKIAQKSFIMLADKVGELDARVARLEK